MPSFIQNEFVNTDHCWQFGFDVLRKESADTLLSKQRVRPSLMGAGKHRFGRTQPSKMLSICHRTCCHAVLTLLPDNLPAFAT